MNKLLKKLQIVTIPKNIITDRKIITKFQEEKLVEYIKNKF
jgi:hypothetical protein